MVGSMNFTGTPPASSGRTSTRSTATRASTASSCGCSGGWCGTEPQPALALHGPGEGFRTEVVAGARCGDPVLHRLAHVACRGAAGGTGFRGRTVRPGARCTRGTASAASRWPARSPRLAAAGCNVRVLAGVGFGPRVLGILERAGVGVRRTGGGQPGHRTRS